MQAENTTTTAVNAGAFHEEGVLVDLGFGHSVRFYPLSWGAMRRLRKEWGIVFGQNTDPASPEWQDATATILHASASRGQSSLTLDSFLEMLDTRNVSKCFEALAAASGMKRVQQGPGETAARPTVSPTGAPSTQSSSQTPDGPSQNAMS